MRETVHVLGVGLILSGCFGFFIFLGFIYLELQSSMRGLISTQQASHSPKTHPQFAFVIRP
jgi:hypothetical protein